MQALFNFTQLGTDLSPLNIASMSWYLIPILVMIASLLGSSHCASMCGGIVMALPPGKASQSGYHVGRLLGYLSLGALAGLAGESLLTHSSWLTTLSAVLMGSILVWTAVKVWRGQSLHIQLPAFLNALIQKPLSAVLSGLRKNNQGPDQTSFLTELSAGLSVGTLTVLLPCGWLYTFVIGAVSTRNLWLGALYLFSFWLGTVPLLALGPNLANAWLKRRSSHQRHWVAGLFLLAGLLSIGLKTAHSHPVDASQLPAGRPAVSCHQH